MRLLAFCLFCSMLPASAAEDGFVSLFNGKDLTGWQLAPQKKPSKGYVVENGSITCPPDGGGNLYTVKEYSNFVFRFEFRLSENTNNGIGIRAPLEGDAAYVGMEIQVLDDNGPQFKGKLRPAQYHGSIYDVVPAKNGFLKPTGEWNSEEVIADGRRIKVTLNGTVIVDADLDSITDPAALKKHPGLQRRSGFVGFLGHNSPVQFRNIRIKEL
jgi:hypothetical protein